MSETVALVTGAGGEMGRLLVPALAAAGARVVATDLEPLPDAILGSCADAVQADLQDRAAVGRLFDSAAPTAVYHLAAVLSASAEADPERAHRVNVEATWQLMGLAARRPTPCLFLFPSSIAAFGLPDAATKERAGAVREQEWVQPVSIYGANKAYCELVGACLARRDPPLDFRCIRFPGLISAESVPSGGTTDYAPEMIHAAAQGRPYSCFVREDTRLPFMTMPDAVEAVLRLAAADPGALTTRVYNIQGFSASAAQIRDETRRHFPAATIDFRPEPRRQALVDSWPAAVDDARARRDWGLAPRHDLGAALAGYLVPALRRRSADAVER